MTTLSPADLANTISAYATTLSGLVPLLLVLLVAPHPRRWVFVYLCVFITGLATVWNHGFGETFPARVADIGTNLLVTWALQIAIAGDYYSRAAQKRVALVSGIVNAGFIAWMIAAGPERRLAIAFPGFGEFTYGEVLLIANVVFTFGLFYVRHAQIPIPARRVLYLITALFAVGAFLASASNSKVDYQVLAYHATWHIVGAYGLILIWVFNQLRRL